MSQTETKARHRLAGKTVRLAAVMGSKALDGQLYRVEDTWVGVSGFSVGEAYGRNIAATQFVDRTIVSPSLDRATLASGRYKVIPDTDPDKVLYGKVGPFGHIIHESEIAEEDPR